jgi:hypothetical protein
MRTELEAKAELRRIAKEFRKEERLASRYARREKDNDCPVTAAHYEGEASALKYCAEHVEAVVSKMKTKSSEKKVT